MSKNFPSYSEILQAIFDVRIFLLTFWVYLQWILTICIVKNTVVLYLFAVNVPYFLNSLTFILVWPMILNFVKVLQNRSSRCNDAKKRFHRTKILDQWFKRFFYAKCSPLAAQSAPSASSPELRKGKTICTHCLTTTKRKTYSQSHDVLT